MKILKSFLILTVLTGLFTSCGAGVYFPSTIEIPITVEDSDHQVINGVKCILLRDGVNLDQEISDINGKCLLKTIQSYSDSDLGFDEFYSLLTVTIIDTDGTNNGGSFVMQTYQVNGLEDCKGITITLEKE